MNRFNVQCSWWPVVGLQYLYIYIYTYMLYQFTFHTIGTHFFRTRDHKHNDHPIFLGPGLKLLMASSGAPALASMRQTAPWRQIFRSNTFGILFGHGCFVPCMKLGQVWDVWAQPHGEDLTALTHGTPQGTESKLRVHGIGHLCEASQVGWSQGKGWCWIQVQPSLKHLEPKYLISKIQKHQHSEAVSEFVGPWLNETSGTSLTPEPGVDLHLGWCCTSFHLGAILHELGSPGCNFSGVIPQWFPSFFAREIWAFCGLSLIE